MRPLRSLLTLTAASLALAACNDRPSTEPTAPGQLRPSFVLGPLPSVCDISVLRDNAKIYAAKSNDPIFKIISDLGKSPTTDKAFDGLARMALIRLTSLQNSSATGAAFDALAKGFLGCADASVRAGVPDVDFAPYLQAGYLFEVRGGSADPSVGAYQRGNAAPYWGVEGSSWPTRLLLYGTPNEALLNAKGRVGSGIDIETIPLVATGTIAVNVGLCAISGTPGTDPGSRRASHEGVFGSYVSLNCTRGAQNGTVLTQGSSFDTRTLARRVIDLFAPQPLHAATAVFAGSVGLGAEGLSPFAVFDLSQVVLGSLGTIADGSNTESLAVTTSDPTYGYNVVVRATDSTGVGLVGVPVQMAIQGNSSSIAFFRVGTDTVPTVTRTTNATGYAVFDNVVLIKAGGYTLNFRVYFDDLNIADVVGAQILPSNPFQIQNK